MDTTMLDENTSIRLSKPPARYDISNLSVLMYAKGFTLWHYKGGASSMKVVMEPNYFGDAADMMAIGDMVMVSCKDKGAVLFVTEAERDRVTVARMA